MEINELLHIEAFDGNLFGLSLSLCLNMVPCLWNICWMNKSLSSRRKGPCTLTVSPLLILTLLQHPRCSNLLMLWILLRVSTGRPSYSLAHNNYWISICRMNDHVFFAWIVHYVVSKLSDFLVVVPIELLAPEGLELYFTHPSILSARHRTGDKWRIEWT